MSTALIPRVVKKHYIFKGKRAGEVVMCAPSELSHASAQAATLSVEEHEASLAPKVSAPTGPTSVDLARQFTDRLAVEAQHAKEAEQHLAEREAEKAQAEAEKVKAKKPAKAKQ